MLTQVELIALKTFARDHGRTWKSQLRDRWERANCCAALQSVRNKIGPSGLCALRQVDLDNVKLPPTSVDQFVRATSLHVELVAITCVTNCQAADKLTDDESAWFVVHCDTWVRWFHANDARWKKTLEGKGNRGRDWVYTFVNHWLAAYVRNPEQYQQRHPIESLCTPTA